MSLWQLSKVVRQARGGRDVRDAGESPCIECYVFMELGLEAEIMAQRTLYPRFNPRRKALLPDGDFPVTQHFDVTKNQDDGVFHRESGYWAGSPGSFGVHHVNGGARAEHHNLRHRVLTVMSEGFTRHIG